MNQNGQSNGHQFDLRCLKRKQRNSGYRRSSQDVKTQNYLEDVGSKCDQQDLWLHG